MSISQESNKTECEHNDHLTTVNTELATLPAKEKARIVANFFEKEGLFSTKCEKEEFIQAVLNGDLKIDIEVESL